MDNQRLDRTLSLITVGRNFRIGALHGYKPESLPSGVTFSRFTPPANTGLGYLEAVSDADIIGMADPNDSDNDGISGRGRNGKSWLHS